VLVSGPLWINDAVLRKIQELRSSCRQNLGLMGVRAVPLAQPRMCSRPSAGGMGAVALQLNQNLPFPRAANLQ
jgi:hypothetical protein